LQTFGLYFLRFWIRIIVSFSAYMALVALAMPI